MRTATIIFALALAAACGEPDPAIDVPTKSTCPPTQTLTYDNFGKGFVNAYCIRCHSATALDRKGAPSDHNFDTVEDVRQNREHIDQKAASGPAATNTLMPYDGDKPTTAERRKLGEWLACGAP